MGGIENIQAPTTNGTKVFNMKVVDEVDLCH